MIPKGLLPRSCAKALDRPNAHLVVIFDGTCGFCTYALDVVMRHREVDGTAIVPYQWLSDDILSRLGTNRARCEKQLHAVRPGESILSGARAVNALCETLPHSGPLLSALGRVRLLIAVEQLLYAWMARNRSVISHLLGTAKFALLTDET